MKPMEEYRGASVKLSMAMLDKGISKADFAREADMPVQSLYNMLNRNTMKYKQVEMFADILGCDIVLRDRETGKIY